MHAEAGALEPAAAFGVARSFTGRRWRLAEGDEAAAQAMARDANISAALARLLLARGIAPGAVADYLNPTLKRFLPEPLSLKDMDKAVARVAQALRTGEPIAIWGDYDVDGSTSAALLFEFLVAAGARPRVYIPDRMTEGYGPNAAGLLKLKAEGIGLVVTVDCGAGAAPALTAARAAGLDVVVLDHHAVEAPPPAVAHVNPNQPGDTSGLGHVCAAGITFLFAVALNRALREAGWYAARQIPEPDLRDALDLVGLATVCDVVPLIGVNRAFVRLGLARLATLKRPGLAALAAVATTAPPFTPYHLGFLFGPRINAGGRVGRSSLGVDLLTAADAGAAQELAQALDTHNRERQALEKLILDEAIAQAETQANAPFLLVAEDGWHAGVVGIVAGRLKDRFAKPAFVAGFEGGLGRGSARSVAGIDIGAMVRSARDAKLIDSGGGHAMAAGFGLKPEQVEGFRAFLAERFSNSGAALAAMSALELDAAVSPAGATIALVEELAQAGPYGAGNAEPLLVLPDVQVVFADVVGKDHVRLRLAGGDGARLDAIAFRIADQPLGKALLAARGRRIHAAGRLRADEWQGKKRVQLQLEDAAPAGS
ncbi:MAG TPA: single-stranded-DNA-specific exonuclease RecJ [Rhizomicrobium sp.]|jgi:single-stranded-DNA-specific exonuclease|nr:single-stranded-DNA-specific exonuclease RecJ [Rhizomicrobium sp.]